MIDDKIDQLSGKCVFIVLDLKSGFYKIPMHPDSVKYTAFITPDGHWEFLRVPFRLANGPAVFQRVMNKVLKEHALIYIDDILIAARDIDKAFEKLETVLKLLWENNLTLNLSTLKIDYLGREISSEGVKPGNFRFKRF